MPVSVGIMLPSRETAMTGLHDARGLIAFARAAEDAVFDSVWVGDSLLARTLALAEYDVETVYSGIRIS